MTATPSVTPTPGLSPTPTPTPSSSADPVGAIYFMVFPAATSMHLQAECVAEGEPTCDCYAQPIPPAEPPSPIPKCNGGVFTVTSSAHNQDSATNGIFHWKQHDPEITMTDGQSPNNLTPQKLVEDCTYIGWGYISSDFVPEDPDALALESTQTSWTTNEATGCCELTPLGPAVYNITFAQFIEKMDLSTTCGTGTVNNPYRIFTAGSEGGPELCGTSCFGAE